MPAINFFQPEKIDVEGVRPEDLDPQFTKKNLGKFYGLLKKMLPTLLYQVKRNHKALEKYKQERQHHMAEAAFHASFGNPAKANDHRRRVEWFDGSIDDAKKASESYFASLSELERISRLYVAHRNPGYWSYDQ